MLAEQALGGPAALQATPLQRVAGGATCAVNLPARYAAETVNRTIENVQSSTEATREKVSAAGGEASQLTETVRDALIVARNASLQRAEKNARRDGDRLKQPEDVRAIITYEEAHAARSSVISAAQTQLAAIAKQAVGIS